MQFDNRRYIGIEDVRIFHENDSDAKNYYLLELVIINNNKIGYCFTG